ncbi:MAG TPA: FxLYD domain-containing protein [Candidatus Dormibacteraeota bacterium]|nr:FxLYD domain-containing protein [Candidatus Dormibacteraeota bacterium]
MSAKSKSDFPVAFLVGAAIVALIIAGVFFLTRSAQPGRAGVAPLPMGPQEQSYAAKIRFTDFQMGRAQNLLNQESTYIGGTVVNDGDRVVRDIEVTVEFHDAMNQVVLRERRRLMGSYGAPQPAGASREFQFTFEHVPVDWNVQVPSIRVTGLLL